MKILHWAFVLIAIILPVSLICRNTVNSRFAALKDEVRINNAIDTATHDAIDQIIAVSGFDFSDEFGGVIDITPTLAQETIDTFFHTLAVNYNIPYKISDSTLQVGDSTESYIKNYFASYVPAILVIAYDGFYIYSQELVTTPTESYYTYQLSPKIPYTTEVTYGSTTYTIGYTLGDDIYFYMNVPSKGPRCYSGKLNYNSYNEIVSAYSGEGYKEYFGEASAADPDEIAAFTTDISMILYSLNSKVGIDIGPELLPGSADFLLDYTKQADGSYKVGAFHENRRKTIIKIISECLNEEINVEHNRFAAYMGSTYDFYLPEITDDDWINTIDDITVMAFVQGIPVGTTEGVFYNSYALGGSQIVKKDYVYMNKMKSNYSSNEMFIYHKPSCRIFTDGYDGKIYDYNKDPDAAGSVDEIFYTFLNEDSAIAFAEGQACYPCQWCH